MDISTILAKICLKPADVHDVYLIGSRLYGTADDRTSDYDVLVVTKAEGHSREVAASPVDALIMGPTAFETRFLKGGYKELLCVHGPQAGHLFRGSGAKGIDVLTRLRDRRAVAPAAAMIARACGDAHREWTRVQKYIEKRDLPRAKKTLLCKVRELLVFRQALGQFYGNEATENSFELDFTTANEWFERLQEVYHLSAEGLEEEFGVEFRELVGEVSAFGEGA